MSVTTWAVAAALRLAVGPTPGPSGTASPRPRPSAGPAATDPVSPLANLDIRPYVVLALAAWLVIYLASLLLHPSTKCGKCKGTGKHRGALYTFASRPCTACGGKGTQLRLGRHLFFRSRN